MFKPRRNKNHEENFDFSTQFSRRNSLRKKRRKQKGKKSKKGARIFAFFALFALFASAMRISV